MNYTKRYLDGYLSDEPLSRYEKLKSTRHKTTTDKERTIVRKKARIERFRVDDGWEYRHPTHPLDGWEYQKIQE